MSKVILRKSLIIVILLAIASALYFIFIKKPDIGNGKKIKNEQPSALNYIKTADKVTIEMLKSDYWLEKQEKPDEVIMTPMEIELWNKQYINTKFWEGDDITENTKYAYTVARSSIRKEPTNNLEPAEKGNDYFCELQVSSILLNEPVVILDESEDGLWYYIRCRYCEGWIEQKNVAICENFQQWETNMKPEHFLLVIGNKVILDVNTERPEISELILYMGTKLELIKYEYYVALENTRVPYECYIVKIPVRGIDGILEYQYAFVPVSCDVSIGYLPYTESNLVTQMFKLNGDRYGWGGMYNARDCSQYVMEIYSLFGFKFARNSAAQAQMPFEGYDLTKISETEKKARLDKTPIGSLLYFEGHIMMYLGRVDGEYYVISQTARILDGENIVNAHSCMITPLSIKRPNGKTWLSELSIIKCIR